MKLNNMIQATCKAEFDQSLKTYNSIYKSFDKYNIFAPYKRYCKLQVLIDICMWFAFKKM